MLAFILILAGQNAVSFLLMDKSPANDLKYKRLDQWHRDNVLLNVVAIVPFLMLDLKHVHLYILYALVLRVALFDVLFNYLARLKYTYIGETAKVDKIFRKVFGAQGAVKKAIVFILVLVLLNIFLH